MLDFCQEAVCVLPQSTTKTHMEPHKRYAQKLYRVHFCRKKWMIIDYECRSAQRSELGYPSLLASNCESEGEVQPKHGREKVGEI